MNEAVSSASTESCPHTTTQAIFEAHVCRHCGVIATAQPVSFFSPNQRLQHHHHHFFIIICLISLAFSVPKYKSPHAKVFSLHSSVGTRIISSSSSHLISPLRSVRVGRRARTHIVALAKLHLTCVQLVREVLVLGSLVGGGISNRSSSFNCLLSPFSSISSRWFFFFFVFGRRSRRQVMSMLRYQVKVIFTTFASQFT